MILKENKNFRKNVIVTEYAALMPQLQMGLDARKLGGGGGGGGCEQKGADISAFIVLESTISKLATREISIF